MSTQSTVQLQQLLTTTPPMLVQSKTTPGTSTAACMCAKAQLNINKHTTVHLHRSQTPGQVTTHRWCLVKAQQAVASNTPFQQLEPIRYTVLCTASQRTESPCNSSYIHKRQRRQWLLHAKLTTLHTNHSIEKADRVPHGSTPISALLHN